MTDPAHPDDGDDEWTDATDAERGAWTRGFRLDVGVRSVTDLLENLADLADAGRAHDGVEGHVDRGVSRRPSAPDPSDTSTSGTPEYPVHVERGDREVVVVADLSGVAEEDVVVGRDRNDDLVVAAHDRVVGRVSLPWPAGVPATRRNNGVLEVRVRPAER
ncbi:gas vesicle protein GvpH [Halomarina ordinaria]|uniref:Gas vesicle protein GvpH n=1 Tax=Halomarina ordinaria TaxID=3033939 RepID=A0ABD5U8Q7_9EURY|nr:gas vesicle protein GvpH [Halomarina sp. PSRA2]